MVLELQRPVTRSEEQETDEVDFTRFYTLAEFEALELPDTDINGNEVEYELIKGHIVAKKSGPGAEHGAILSRLVTKLDVFGGFEAGGNKKGTVFTGSNSNLGIEANVIPDLCFVLDERITTPFTGSILLAPDIIAEINSPTDTTERIQEKIEQYQLAGVKIVWSIYLKGKFVLVYRAGNEFPQLLNLKDELDGGEVLPGFKLPVSYLFQ